MAQFYSLENSWRKHESCTVVIYNRQFANGLTTPGLYCKEYGTWIQWLNQETADTLINEGVEQVLEKPTKKKHPVKWADSKELNI